MKQAYHHLTVLPMPSTLHGQYLLYHSVRLVLFGVVAFALPLTALAQDGDNTFYDDMAGLNMDASPDDEILTDLLNISDLDNSLTTTETPVVDVPTTSTTETTTSKKSDHRLNLNQNRSLTRLSQYYHRQPNTDARCHGAWIQPTQINSEQASEQTEGQIKEQNGAIYAQANYGYWDNHDYAEMSGNVIIEQNGQHLTADKVIYHPSTGQMTAGGQVMFSDGANSLNGDKTAGILGVAETMSYDKQNNHAIAQDVAFASTTIGAHGHAKQMTKVNDRRYQMNDVMFSTCPPDARKWHLDAEAIDINTDTGRGIARNSTLRIADVPVFYLPYFNFPIDGRRTSGFLLPSAGFGVDGFELNTPYYLNLAPNYDATITPTIFSNKNPMLTGEFRYLTHHLGSGVVTGSYLPDDRKYNKKDRHRLFYDHNWNSERIPHLHAYATYRNVSDSDYLSDFDTLGLENNPLNLPRRIGAGYYNDYLSADIRAEAFQSLVGTRADGSVILDKDKPYSRLPQLAINYRLPKIGKKDGQNGGLGDFARWDNFEITGTHNTAYFKKSITDGSDTEKSGVRMYNNIWASYLWLKPWGYITPKIGISHLYTSYDEDSLVGQNLIRGEGTHSVFAPHVSIDTGLFFEKKGSPFGLYDDNLGGHQVITPRLKYSYTPYKNQSKIPNFETTIAGISYEQLFADSWMIGYDRIQDLHAITPALAYRYIDNSGLTRLDAGVAEQILLDDVKVGISDSESFTGRSSGMAWQLSAQPKTNLWLDASGSLTSQYDLSALIAQVRYQPNDKSLFNVGMVRRKEHKATGQLPLSAYTAATIFPISNNWRVLSQAQYDFKNDRLLDALVGLNYEDCCYGLSIYARRYRNDLTLEAGMKNAIMAEIRLNGITHSSHLNRLMSDKVMGYDNTQHAWIK